MVFIFMSGFMVSVRHPPQVIDKKTSPDEVVKILHDWAGQEQNLLPFVNVHHLSFDMKSFVNIL